MIRGIKGSESDADDLSVSSTELIIFSPEQECLAQKNDFYFLSKYMLTILDAYLLMM